LACAAGIVAASTAGLPSVTGYGTNLFQIVVFTSWGILARVTSGSFADTHHFVLWPIVCLLNVFLFLVPEFVIWLVTRRHWLLFSGATLMWCAFWIASLFWLFPATDGP
jgi:hypothetical protein